jgi:adenosylmethionine---8-amino-7-oxononanoate aminotransferase
MNYHQLDKDLIWHPYTQEKNAPENILINRGEGAYLIDEDGRRLFDACSSWWTNTHGHAHPYFAEKLYQQAKELEHVIFAGYTHKPAIDLAVKLKTFLPENQQKFFFSDNGSTAVETALKMAFQFWFNQGEKRTKIIALENAYHGDTFGSMSISARGLFTDPYKPLLFDIITIPIQEQFDRDFIDSLLNKNNDIAAFIYEPLVQGAAGMNIYSAAWLDEVMQTFRNNNILLIADEVMTGFGRTGKMFATDYMNTKPDIMCFSKGLTAGMLPLGLTSASQEIYDAFYNDDKTKTFFHGHSFTGNPLGCAVALASLELFEQEKTLKKIAMIEQIHSKFATQLASYSKVSNIKQQGTILRFEIKTEQSTSYLNELKSSIINHYLERRIMIRPLGNVIYFMPPYCAEEDDIKRLYDCTSLFLKQI